MNEGPNQVQEIEQREMQLFRAVFDAMPQLASTGLKFNVLQQYINIKD